MMKHMNHNNYIGCSGYYYPYWKNRFYPQGLQPKSWLQYYSSVFNTVELNGTFYRTPKLSDLQKYNLVTPPDFKFSVKMSRYVTHVMKLKDCTQQVVDFSSLIKEGLGEKLSCFLFQLPPSFHYNEENLQRVLDTIPHTQQNVVEFRHLSWWNETVADELKKAKITFCNVDFPGLSSYIIQTTKLFYFRFHGNPELFKSSYSVEQLKAFWKDHPAACSSHYIYFNNTYYEAGYSNALELMKITSGK
jgi:uncharacterized protein YecE (DUF72 family)